MFNRTFGCVRLVWNKTLGERNQNYFADGARTSYRQTDAALTEWKRTPELGFLSEVSSVPLQQTLRHQHTAFQNFFAGRARRPRFKSRTGRQSAHYTRAAFRMRDGVLALAKNRAPLRFVWSFDVDVTKVDPTMVVISRDPDDRWYVTFAVDVEAPPQALATGRAIGLDLGLKDFLVTSDGHRISNPGIWTARLETLLATNVDLLVVSAEATTAAWRRPRLPVLIGRSATRGRTSCTAPALRWCGRLTSS